MPTSDTVLTGTSPADIFLSAHTDSALRDVGVPYDATHVRAVLNMSAW